MLHEARTVEQRHPLFRALSHNIGSHGWPPFSGWPTSGPTAQINPTPSGRINPLACSIFQSKNDPEMRNRFQYRMILKIGTLAAGGFPF
jgi:hypothetical protein